MTLNVISANHQAVQRISFLPVAWKWAVSTNATTTAEKITMQLWQRHVKCRVHWKVITTFRQCMSKSFCVALHRFHQALWLPSSHLWENNRCHREAGGQINCLKGTKGICKALVTNHPWGNNHAAGIEGWALHSFLNLIKILFPYICPPVLTINVH